jgi:hypothetical protein
VLSLLDRLFRAACTVVKSAPLAPTVMMGWPGTPLQSGEPLPPPAPAKPPLPLAPEAPALPPPLFTPPSRPAATERSAFDPD